MRIVPACVDNSNVISFAQHNFPSLHFAKKAYAKSRYNLRIYLRSSTMPVFSKLFRTVKKCSKCAKQCKVAKPSTSTGPKQPQCCVSGLRIKAKVSYCHSQTVTKSNYKLTITYCPTAAATNSQSTRLQSSHQPLPGHQLGEEKGKTCCHFDTVSRVPDPVKQPQVGT